MSHILSFTNSAFLRFCSQSKTASSTNLTHSAFLFSEISSVGVIMQYVVAPSNLTLVDGKKISAYTA